MNWVTGCGLFVLLLGVVMCGTAGLMWRRHRQETGYVTAPGIVTRVDADSSGEFVTVQFSPEGQLLVGGQAVHFTAGASTGEHQVGKTVTVHYDPRRPHRANLRGAGVLAGVAASLGACGALTFPFAALLLLWLGPLQASRDEVLGSFIKASRLRDSARISALSVPGAKVAPEWLDRVARSGTYHLGSNNIGFSSDACIEVFFDSDPRPHYVYMQKPSDWRIVRANAKDAHCIDDLDD
ncbi:MAG: DUF3592 domain-containing protein [Polyangiaceae bacterium]|nr:DUF3592 domain-containing protein [Polyangiaceae bacterium]